MSRFLWAFQRCAVILKVMSSDFHLSVLSLLTGNTVSNLIMILPPIYGAIQTFRDGLESRYICSFLGLAGWCTGSALMLWLLRERACDSYWEQWLSIYSKRLRPNVLTLNFCVLCVLFPHTQAVGVGSWCFHMTLLYEMQVGCKSEHVSKSGHKLNSWAFATWPNACLYSDVVMRVSFLFCLVICSYWMSCLWFTVPAFLSTVCKCLHLFGSIVAALTWEQIQYHCKMNQWILYW